MFYLPYEIQHSFSIYNGVTTLEITPIFNGVTWTLSCTQAWESQWWQEFEIVRKMAVFLVSSGKKITFTTFGHPQKNFSKNPLVLPLPGKHHFDAHALQNYTIFGKNCATPMR